jgi:LysM repeat protein
MKIPNLFAPKKKLRATTTRRSFNEPDEMDYEEMAEPNMKLSRALLIVLVLHVVAVSGIIAFNTIKSRQGTFPPAPTVKVEAQGSPAKPAASATPAAGQPVVANAATAPAKPLASPEAAPLKALPVTPDGPNVYTVAKGDNPVKIAKKLKVSESELLALNGIDDPRKLQIGQKLLVPAKKTNAKKSGN